MKTSKNDITGDEIKTKGSSSDLYRDGWDRIFGKKNTKDSDKNNAQIAQSEEVAPLNGEK